MSLKTADSFFSKFIRVRDADEDGDITCVSCPKVTHWTKADCGHFIKRQHKALRYNEKNCNAQCKECNWLKQGNDIQYAKGLEKKYGLGTVDTLQAMSKNTLHLGRFELKVIEEHYHIKFLELKKRKGL